ncbi:MAG: penicillin-binding protein activator [Gammaproteobacteria bacterium]|nr:penicillin-binding protein activator [Gammaproteobacteria bacterium]
MGRSYLASARERIFIHGLLDEEGKDANHEQIFATLMEMPASSLASQAEKAITSDIRGWLSLASLAKRNQGDPLEQLIALNRWKKVWPHHPAASRMPTSLELLSKIVAERLPGRSATRLPLHGDLAPFGRAIRDGLMAAHFETNAEPHSADIRYQPRVDGKSY